MRYSQQKTGRFNAAESVCTQSLQFTRFAHHPTLNGLKKHDFVVNSLKAVLHSSTLVSTQHRKRAVLLLCVVVLACQQILLWWVGHLSLRSNLALASFRVSCAITRASARFRTLPAA